MDDGRSRAANRRFTLALLLVFLTGALLAAYRLGAQSLWLDEAYTWWFARLGWKDLFQAIRIDAVNPPLYYIFVKLLSPNLTEAGLRLPSVLAHVAGIAGAAALGLFLAGRPGAVAAGLVWAVHPLSLWAARDARPYALSAMLAVLAAACFVRLQRGWSTPWAASAGALVALGLLAHYFFFVLLASLLALAAFDMRRSPAFFRRWTALSLIAMIPLAIWLAWFFSTGSPSLGIGWIRTPEVADMPLSAWNLASGYGGVFDLTSILLGAVLAGVAAFSARGVGPVTARLALGGIALPVAAVWVISQRRPVYVDRYFIVLLPFLIALVALGGRHLASVATGGRRRTWATVAIGAGVVITSAAGAVVHTAPKFAKEDWRGLVGFLRSGNVSPGSLSLSEPEIALPLSYYFTEDLVDDELPLIPECPGECWWVLRRPYTATHALTQSVTEPGRPPPPEIPPWCRQADVWESPTGVAVWKLDCDPLVTEE
jgi:hypothetical protein